MATQGLVTVRGDNKVVMKVIAGCDGYNAKKLATALKGLWPVDAQDAYDIALSLGFGSTSSLVVITESETIYKGEEELDPRYRETFHRTRFNPRWEHGTADFISIIEV